MCQIATEGPFGDPSCSDNIDNDCDSLIDEVDSDCWTECMVVTTAIDEGDSGEGASPPHQSTGLSLREAITLANVNGGSDCIVFSGPMAITLLSPLPDVLGLGGLRIDGGQEVIVEDTADIVFNALKIDSEGNAIVGLQRHCGPSLPRVFRTRWHCASVYREPPGVAVLEGRDIRLKGHIQTSKQARSKHSAPTDRRATPQR